MGVALAVVVLWVVILFIGYRRVTRQIKNGKRCPDCLRLMEEPTDHDCP